MSSDLDVHEWGLIDVALSATDAQTSAVPSCGDAPEVSPRPRPRPRPPIGRPRAPLLYFHLPSDHAPVDVSVRVALTDGAMTEHWPPAAMPLPNTLSWTTTVRPEHCAGSSYPTTCAPLARCEATELAAFETADAACVRVGEADFASLFYAGEVPLASPLRIVRGTSTVSVLDDSDDPLPGPVYLFQRGADRAHTMAAMVIAQPHSAVAMPALIPAMQLAVAPFDVMHSQHMTSAEIAAFSRAWSCAVYGGPREDGTPCSTEPQPTHFVLFWLPRARIDALAPLTITPEPAHIERAILVRVDLDR